MKIIIGLGNPGEKYEKTRHNVGFDFLDYFAEQKGFSWTYDKKKKAYICREADYLLIKPCSYMNLSGEPVSATLAYFGLLPKNMKIFRAKNADLSENLTVVHDDLDIDFSKYKISIDSRSAGHRGVQSIIDCLKTKNFRRLRIGIRNEQMEFVPTEKFVLQRFNKEEKETLRDIYPQMYSDLEK